MDNTNNTNGFDIRIEDGIVHASFLEECFTYEMANAGVLYRLNLTKDKCYPLLSDITRLKDISKEARLRLAEKDAQGGTSACAILIKSKTQKIIYNFFILFTKSPIPTKMFTNREKAKEWLEQYKNR